MKTEEELLDLANRADDEAKEQIHNLSEEERAKYNMILKEEIIKKMQNNG